MQPTAKEAKSWITSAASGASDEVADLRIEGAGAKPVTEVSTLDQ